MRRRSGVLLLAFRTQSILPIETLAVVVVVVGNGDGDDYYAAWKLIRATRGRETQIYCFR